MLSRLKKIINKSLFGINVFFGILLLASYLGALVPPSKFYIVAIIALGYPILVLVNIIFACWWLYRRKRYFYFSLIVILLGHNHLLNFFAFNFLNAHADTQDDLLQVMSYNVRYFDAPFYKKSNKEKLTKEHQDILNIIENQKIDIFCGQEFSGKTLFYNELADKELANKMNLKYSYKGGGSSLAIFSKYPILKKGIIQFEATHNGAIYVDVKVKHQIVRVYNFHLQSIRLGEDEEELLKQQNLTSLNKNETQEKYKRIGGKLKNAFLLREQQVDYIAQHISKSPYPVIVCGDMNDTPSSYAYHQISSNLKDAFREKGAGFGSTYVGLLPFLRIDYILLSPSLKLQTFQVLGETSSDHYPIYTQISW